MDPLTSALRGVDFGIHKAVQLRGGRYGGRSPLSPKKELVYLAVRQFDLDFDFEVEVFRTFFNIKWSGLYYITYRGGRFRSPRPC